MYFYDNGFFLFFLFFGATSIVTLQITSHVILNVLGKLKIKISESFLKSINTFFTGSISILIFSVYNFIKLRSKGFNKNEALKISIKQSMYSLSLLCVSIATQLLLGNIAVIIVSISIGIITLSYSIANIIHNKNLVEKIKIYSINKCHPRFIE